MPAENHPSVSLYACPTCHARVGEYCKKRDGSYLGWTHKRRGNLAKKPKGTPSGQRYCENPSACNWWECNCAYSSSVATVSGGAFEMNRRRH